MPSHAILRCARADLLIFYMFLQYSEKNTAWGIDESYHRCYSFTKIKKDVEVFRKCAESFWKFNFRKVHDRRSKTFRCWFSSKTRTDGRRRGLKTEWSLEKLLKRVPKVQCSDAESLRQKDRVKKDTEEKQPRNKKSGAQKRKNSGSAVFCCIFQSEPCSAGKIPQEMVFFFSKRCGCVIHIVQTIRRMEREKRKWMH